MGKMLRASVAPVLAAANGQSVTGTILGTGTDTSSAVISSAKVTNEAANTRQVEVPREGSPSELIFNSAPSSSDMPNHANLRGPGTNISLAASIGRITSVGDPRQIQFGLGSFF